MKEIQEESQVFEAGSQEDIIAKDYLPEGSSRDSDEAILDGKPAMKKADIRKPPMGKIQ